MSRYRYDADVTRCMCHWGILAWLLCRTSVCHKTCWSDQLTYRLLDVALAAQEARATSYHSIGEALSALAGQIGKSEMELNETYLKLLCQFRPQGVLKTLNSLTSYRAQARNLTYKPLRILKNCQFYLSLQKEACMLLDLRDLPAVESMRNILSTAEIAEHGSWITNQAIYRSSLLSRSANIVLAMDTWQSRFWNWGSHLCTNFQDMLISIENFRPSCWKTSLSGIFLHAKDIMDLVRKCDSTSWTQSFWFCEFGL